MSPARLYVTGLVLVAAACRPAPVVPTVPLFGTLGAHHHAITTDSPLAQRYFDQGLALCYAFNHGEAIRAFRQALDLDPACAMCWWGVAFALGPNINAPITPEAAVQAFAAIEEARTLAGKVSEKERAYIEALAKRYTPDPRADRTALDGAYADAMGEVAARFPDDLDAATLHAQSLMDTSPWNYWERDGSARPLTSGVLGALESVLERAPDHAGAIHLYIHAVEASSDPARAEPYADRLAALMPGAGHIVHMPAHIYLRTGRYHDATVANERAVKADETYFASGALAENMMYTVGYYPHNIHFMVQALSFEGRRVDALRAAAETRQKMHTDMLRDPAMGGMVQHMHLTPLFTMIRFRLWDEVLAEPAPPEDLPYMRAVWHAARGLAYTAAGRSKEAEAEYRALAELAGRPELETLGVSNVNMASAIVAIAKGVLSGEIAARARRLDEAARHFEEAVALEDGLTYMEPPDWPIPVRSLQGATLLELGRPRDAETAFRADLETFPENGWSLSGLQAALERQGRTNDAASVAARFEKAWVSADTELVAGRATYR